MLSFLNIAGIFKIPMYNLMVAIGISLGLVYVDLRARHTMRDPSILYLPITGALLSGIAGAFLVQYLFAGLPGGGIMNAGMTFYGGLVLGLPVLVTGIRISQLSIPGTLNLLAPALVLAHAFGRAGCFFAGCCFGRPSGHFPGVVFPPGSLPYRTFGCVPLHPTQLYEAAGLLFLFAIMAAWKKAGRHAFAVYCIGYGLLRFVLEFLRADRRGSFFGISIISPAQVISLALMAVGIMIYVRIIKKTG